MKGTAINHKRKKVCPHCGRKLWLRDFYPVTGGYSSWCKHCQRQNKRDWYEKNHKVPDGIRQCQTDGRIYEHRGLSKPWREKIYKANFMHVAWSVNYVTDLDIEDCKDLAQSAFIYLCTDGYRPIQHKTDIVGLWVEYARMRAVDYIRRRWIPDSELVERHGNRDKPYEIDLFHLQPGEKRSTYLRMWAEGNTPTEIADVCGCKPSTVGASVTRSIQFLQRYFKKEL